MPSRFLFAREFCGLFRLQCCASRAIIARFRFVRWRSSVMRFSASTSELHQVHTVRVASGDTGGRKKLAQYMLRAPLSLEKMTYLQQTGMVMHRSHMHQSLKRNFQLMPGAQWLELLSRYIPNRFEHLVRYVGWCAPSPSSAKSKLRPKKRRSAYTERTTQNTDERTTQNTDGCKHP